MNSAEHDSVIAEAERLSLLGLYQEAWALLESLPPAARTTGSAFAATLSICTGLRKWELGEVLLMIFNRASPEPQRRAAAAFLSAYAAELQKSGRTAEAKARLQQLKGIWPEGEQGAGSSAG